MKSPDELERLISELLAKYPKADPEMIRRHARQGVLDTMHGRVAPGREFLTEEEQRTVELYLLACQAKN